MREWSGHGGRRSLGSVNKMALTIHRGESVALSALKNLSVSVIGYGNQGRAHALNLRDSGCAVTIGQRRGASFDRATADGFQPISVKQAAAASQLVIISLPDESASGVFDGEVAPALPAGGTLGFVHGFNIRYGFITPPDFVDVVMIAPKGPGTLLRSLFLDGKGLPALMAIHQDATGRAMETALTWAAGIGSTRAGVVETTFAVETETDLFGEQVSLCGGVTALTRAAFEVLVEAGYAPEFAYLECVHELKQIVDLIYERGISAMRDRISNTAEYGDLTRGPRIIDEHTRREMRRILDEIRDGSFAKEWISEHRKGGQRFRSLHERDRDTLMEQAGRNVRALMPWLSGDADGQQ